MKIFVTGATGMVGRSILDTLNSTKYDVLSPTRKALDLGNEQAILRFLDREKPDFIIHCAGKVGGIQANLSDPLSFYLDNLDINRNLIFSAYKVGVPRLLNLGTSCMYPRNATNPLKEDYILTGELEPTNEGYALAKIGAQRLCQYITAQSPNFQYKTLIPCNLYGPYDKFDLTRAHLIPAVIHKIHTAKLAHEKTVMIWGDGKARREFLFSNDLAHFIKEKISSFDNWPSVMNIGAEQDHTIKEYYEIIKSVIGYSGNFDYDLNKPVGMQQKLVDASKQKTLSWTPPTALRKGIHMTYEYYLSLLK